MPLVRVNDIEIYYEEQGSGEPLVLIAGFATGAWIWFKQIEHLARDYRLIIFDNRGIARSSSSNQPYTMRTMADDLAALLAHLEISQAHILGASMGGFIAQEFALAYPEKTISLLLCCTSFGGVNHVAPGVETMQALANYQELDSPERVRQNIHLAFARGYLAAHAAEAERIVQLRLENYVSQQTYLFQLQAALSFDTEARIAAIAVPTLIITGDEDRMVPAENSYNLAARLPQARLLTISGAGHCLFIERAQEFNNAVCDFLAAVRAESEVVL